METGWFKSVSLLKTSCPSCSSRTRLIDGHLLPPVSMGNMECIHGLFPIIARYSFLSEYIYEIGYIVGHCAIFFVLCLFFFCLFFFFLFYFVLFCFVFAGTSHHFLWYHCGSLYWNLVYSARGFWSQGGWTTTCALLSYLCIMNLRVNSESNGEFVSDSPRILLCSKHYSDSNSLRVIQSTTR